MLKLFDYWRSSACFRVRIALHLKEVPFDCIPIHLLNNGGEQFNENYQKINPFSLVPALQDGATVITQSYAMIEYLEDKFPQPSLFPKDFDQKAKARAFALSIVADIHPLINLRVNKFLENELQLNETQLSLWYQNWVKKGLSALEKTLAKERHYEFCFGDTPSVADICLVPQLFNARRFNLDLKDFPNLVRVDSNCQKLPAFQAAWPIDITQKATT